MKLRNSVQLFYLLFQTSLAATPTCTLKPTYSAPVLSDGWQAQLIVQNLTSPRGVLFDGSGNLLVVQEGAGIVHLEFNDDGILCLDVAKKTFLVNSTDLNHGIALSNDGKTLYASSSETVFSWSYDASTPSVGKSNSTIITNMSNDDHTTRTLLMSEKEPGTLVVCRGSNSNIDPEAEDLASGHSQIKAFNTNNLTATSAPYDFNTEGRLLGWGLRNSVGVAEEPLHGGVYSVENSADDVDRDGVDIHQNNPGEELNYHGFLNASTADQGGNYGYPYCYALWNTSIPDLGTLTVGSQFTLEQNSTINDTFCAKERVPPRLTFQAHMAPLDIIFLPNGTEAYVSFHGSWDRNPPVGYKVSSLDFDPSSGTPVAEANSLTAATDIFSNANLSNCPDACFRPVGLALDSKGRIFVSSDATGEIYVLVKTSDSTTVTGTGTATATGASPTATKKSVGSKMQGGAGGLLVIALVAFVMW